ncbi:transglycosylase SLT domain-containing protein [Prevotella sp.]|mgnify:FL=1|uniref:lytic transglycosylase domain-containing protein n=1 Tax=uncultured Prevotella sp. TaxID=159272 RepID=UPI0027E23FC7|nr:transglycosylase SLT domain-containing protein [Prevotella sp.]MEE0669599.1 transglycosylase SLT domain-containing protein [Prevotella sp.]
MKQTFVLIAAAIIGFSTPVLAQSDDNETEITVTNAEGKKEIIDLPEAMTNEYDSLLSVYNNRTYLNINTDCNMPDVNPVYSKEVYKERLARIPSVIELPYNDVVQKFIDRYSGRLRRSVSIMLGAQNFYMPTFEEALESYGLPLELKYLPVIESALNPNAVSHVGATGLWQFMLTTGKQYGLEINSLVDERRDPVRASYAAAHYLRDLYKIFGDWNLVIAAYNCGPENINKAIHRSNGATDYWQIYPYLPKETRGYVPAFIAANYIMNYYCDHNICPMQANLPGKTDTVVVSRDVHFEQVAQVLGMEIDQIKQLNPQYRRNIVNGSTRPMALRLPATLVGKFIDNEDSIYAYRPDVLLAKRTEVEVNDDVPSYSRRSSSSSRSKSSSSRKSRSKGKKGKKNKGGRNVTIRQGDTLSDIAKRNGTTVKKLKKLNKISGSSIRAGKKLRIK